MLKAIELVIFDMAGTTVDDRAAGSSLVVTALVQAFARANVTVSPEAVGRHRGKEKIEAIRSLLRSHAASDTKQLESRSAVIHADFLSALHRGLDQLEELEGTTATFRFLKDRGIRVGVGSGFPAEVVERLIVNLGWREDGLIDYVGSAEAVGASRPDPKMIQHAMACLGVTNPGQVLKVGDTVVDVEEGRNAGAWTAAVLTGSQSEEVLRMARPDFLLPSIREVVGLFA